MRTALLPALGALALAFALQPARAAEPNEQSFHATSTGALADLCSDNSRTDPMMTTAAQNFCHGYMVGAYQVLAELNAARNQPAFCIPHPAPSRNQAIAAFVAWVRANPQQAERPPADGVYTFLTQHFPCEGQP